MTLQRWPVYWGTTKNAATLSPTLTGKARIVEGLHGVTLALVQGSPSFSSVSGGTHAGPGNAADFAATGNRRQDLAISQRFRELNCLSYLRGSDADGDGRKDDTFGPHIHIIDLDDLDDLTPNQRWQYDLWTRGLDGLTGGRRDREPRPAHTYTLSQWLNPTAGQPEGDLPMDQPEFSKLMTTWARSPEGRDAIAIAANSATYSVDLNGDGKPDTVGQAVIQDAQVGVESQRRIDREMAAVKAKLDEILKAIK